MKLKCFSFIPPLMLLTISKICFSQESQHNLKNNNDSLSNIVHSIIRTQQSSDSLHAFAMIYAADTPEDWYALFRIDTLKGELIWANSYIYKGKFKYLTKYFFYRNKLIATQTSKSKIKNQDSDKWIDWERNFGYWNDSLIYSISTGNEYFDYKDDLKISTELLISFKRYYTTKKLYFTKGSNIGSFR
jgi:hypothetical protein